MTAPLTSPLGGDDLAKALRDAYGQGAAHFERLRETGESVSSSLDKRDAWIAQYMARLPAAEPIATILPKSAFRQGRRVPRNVYRDDLEPLFMAATEEQAAELVAILNAGAAVLRSGKLVASTGSEEETKGEQGARIGLTGISADIESKRTLKLHFDHEVGDADRQAILDAFNALKRARRGATPEATPKSSPDQTPVDPQTDRDAINFALTIDDHYDRLEFLQSWIKGDLSEWPEFRTLQAGGEVR